MLTSIERIPQLAAIKSRQIAVDQLKETPSSNQLSELGY